MILPKKEKYTMRDVHRVMVDSLFKPIDGRTADLDTAIGIVKSSAEFHKAQFLKGTEDDAR